MKLTIPDLWICAVPWKGCVLKMRGERQTDTYSCGYAAAVCVLKAAATAFDRTELWNSLKPCKTWGVQDSALLKTLRRYKLKPQIVPFGELTFERLAEVIWSGHPVVLAPRKHRQPKGERHWMVLSGVDTENKKVLLLNHTAVPGFSQQWWDYARLKRELMRDDIYIMKGAEIPVLARQYPVSVNGPVRIS